MKDFLTLGHLSLEEIHLLLDDADCFKKGQKCSLPTKKAAVLFFENSTRTQYSFVAAMHNMDIKPMVFSVAGSSVAKGESFYDTVKTFESFGVDVFVIRHSENGYYNSLIGKIKVPLINGGDGTADHPSQSLLDLMTIKQEFGCFKGLNIMIAGDIRHSRVAHGNAAVMRRLGMNVFMSGPKEYADEQFLHSDFISTLPKMDVVMLLRVQNERHEHQADFSSNSYLKNYGLDMDKVSLMKKNAIIMHPAPFNRGVEIADDVVECKKSRIFEQITNGVFCRQAILKRSLL